MKVYKVVIGGNTFIGSYEDCRNLRREAILNNIGCSGITEF